MDGFWWYFILLIICNMVWVVVHSVALDKAEKKRLNWGCRQYVEGYKEGGRQIEEYLKEQWKGY